MNISPIQPSLIEDFFEHGLSYAELARKYGRHETTCRKTVAAYRVQYQASHEGVPRQRSVTPRNSKSASTGKPLSLGHCAIGIRIARYMQRERIGATGFGMLLRPMKGPSIVNLAVTGTYDWTLSDLQGLSMFFNLPFDRLTLMENDNGSS